MLSWGSLNVHEVSVVPFVSMMYVLACLISGAFSSWRYAIWTLAPGYSTKSRILEGLWPKLERSEQKERVYCWLLPVRTFTLMLRGSDTPCVAAAFLIRLHIKLEMLKKKRSKCSDEKAEKLGIIHSITLLMVGEALHARIVEYSAISPPSDNLCGLMCHPKWQIHEHHLCVTRQSTYSGYIQHGVSCHLKSYGWRECMRSFWILPSLRQDWLYQFLCCLLSSTGSKRNPQTPPETLLSGQ